MFNYTSNNHFKFGYNGKNKFQDRLNTRDHFTAEYGVITNPELNWRESNNLAAREIYDKKQGAIVVLLSGGMDSEVCLKSFIDQNLTIKAMTLRFIDIDQKNELKEVERMRSQYQLNHEYVDVKLLDFIGGQEFNQIFEMSKCVSPIINTHLWLADQISGTPVIAQGEIHLKKDIPEGYIPGVSPYLKSRWHLTESERLCSIYKFFISKNKPAIPGFFQYLPEQLFSFLTKNTILQDLISDKIEGKLGTRSSKNLMTRQFYPDVPLRVKLHGWECVQDFHDELRKKLALRFPHHDDNFQIEVEELIEKLSGNLTKS